MLLRSLAAAVLAACLALPAVARDNKPVTPGKYEDWNDLDKVEIVQTFRLADYRSVAVLPLETKGAELPDKSDNTAQAVAQVAGAITATFTKGIAENSPRGVSVAQGADKTAFAAGALVVKARVVKIDPGSEAMRNMLGIGGKIAGAAKVVLAGDVLDGKTRKVLFRFEQQRSSGMNGHNGGVSVGGFHIGGDNPYVTLLNRSAGEIGEDVGNALKAF